jgi:biopolymer transport protein ExbB
MLSKIFLGMSLIGAEWVLYFLLILSIFSIGLIIERIRFYRDSLRGIEEFRDKIRHSTTHGRWEEALKTAHERLGARSSSDMEAKLTVALLEQAQRTPQSMKPTVLNELAQDSVVRTRLQWERNLAMLATIGSNAPFVGLFGTVLGIIKAFHDLSQQVTAGAQTVTAGISEALVATAVGIMVAVPAVVAFNLFQRKVKSAVAEAEALKSFLIGKLAK